MLVGLAVGEEAMIGERLNAREAGDLMDEIHAHRLAGQLRPALRPGHPPLDGVDVVTRVCHARVCRLGQRGTSLDV